VMEAGGGSSSPLEPRAVFERRGHVVTRHLERHVPGEPDVFGDVHLSHPASTERFQYAVVAQLFPDHSAQVRDDEVKRRSTSRNWRKCAAATFAARSIGPPSMPDAGPAVGTGPRLFECLDAAQRGVDFARRRAAAAAV